MFGNLGEKAKKLKSRADDRIQDIRGREGSEEDEINDVEENVDRNPGKAEAEEEESVKREKDIVDEIRGAESDLESLLKLDEEDLQKAFEYFADSIELEKKEDQKLKEAVENLQEIDRELDSLLEEFSGSFQQYRKEVVTQFAQANIERVKQMAEQADPKNSRSNAPGLQGMAAGFLSTRIERVEADKRPDENLVECLAREGLDDDEILKMADWYNQAVWSVEGKNSAVEKPRYTQIQEELQEVINIRDAAKQIAESFKDLRDFEEKIQSDISSELENVPDDLDQLNAVGEDLVTLKNEIDRVELDEQELVKIEKNSSVDSHLQAHQSIQSNIQNIEDNLGGLEKHLDSIAEEVAELEQKDEKFEELDKEEEQELKEILDREEGLKHKAEKLQEEWLEETRILLGQGSNENYQNSNDRDIKKKIEEVFESISKLASIIDTEAMRLGKYSRKEYEEAERFRRFSKERFSDIENDLEEAGFSGNAVEASAGRKATAD